MAKPTQAKEPDGKDKAEGGGPNSLIINVITTAIVCIIFIGVNYFLQSNLLTNQLKKISTEQSEEVAEPLDKPEKGIVLDLGDFTMNLSDVDHRRYLKANVAVEITNPEPTHEEEPKKESGGHSGGHGGHGAPPPDPKAELIAEMEQYKPAIRDSVIMVLTSKTSDELSTTAGKELAKQQIAESVNGIFDGEREVIRVSFGQFIMQ